jgi:hypothetical protein
VFAQQEEITMQATSIASHPALTFDHDKWISCSHWGLFPVPENSSEKRGEK